MFFVGLLLGLIFVSPCVLLYALFIKSIDRYEPEPIWLLFVMFIWGALVATTGAIIVSGIGQFVLVVASGLDPSGQTMEAISATMVAPLTEESTKGIGLLLLWWLSAAKLKELDGPLDGAIYGGVVGLGFTLTEDILYVASATAEGGVGGFAVLFFLRTILAGLAHASFTALIGLGIGIAVEAKHPAIKIFAPFFGWCGAVALHAIHNALVTFFMADGAGFIVKILLFWLIDCVYFTMLIGLVFRDRAILIRYLADEVGRTVHAIELGRTTSYLMFLPLWNYFSLSSSPGGYWAARSKQLALIELAFIKHRRTRGEKGLDKPEHKLRTKISEANQRGVVIGQR